jgi:hypothetical protein
MIKKQIDKIHGNSLHVKPNGTVVWLKIQKETVVIINSNSGQQMKIGLDDFLRLMEEARKINNLEDIK